MVCRDRYSLLDGMELRVAASAARDFANSFRFLTCWVHSVVLVVMPRMPGVRYLYRDVKVDILTGDACLGLHLVLRPCQ